MNEYLEKIDSGKGLSEREIERIVDFYEIDMIEGDQKRWTTCIDSYCLLDDRYFLIKWDRGLTEHQENFYDNQPIEVKKVITKTIIPERIIPEHEQITESWVEI